MTWPAKETFTAWPDMDLDPPLSINGGRDMPSRTSFTADHSPCRRLIAGESTYSNGAVSVAACAAAARGCGVPPVTDSGRAGELRRRDSKACCVPGAA